VYIFLDYSDISGYPGNFKFIYNIMDGIKSVREKIRGVILWPEILFAKWR